MEKIINLINVNLANIYRHTNRISPFLFIFIPLTFLYLSDNLNRNEEQYMQLAKQYVDSEWIFESQNLGESAGTRIIYQLIIGHSLQFLSFEAVVLIFRFLLILAYSIVLGKIYKHISFDNNQILFHLVLFLVIFKQSFFAGSWMLVSVEPKGFAWLAILLSFYHLLKNRFSLALVFLLIASYFHILVGGYSFAYLFLTLLLFRKDAKINLCQLISGAAVYVILLLPFVIYLKTTSLDQHVTSYEVTPSWIYTYFRSPNHTALFLNLKYFLSTHYPGIIQAVIWLLAAITFYPIMQNRSKLKLINQFVIISLAGTLLLVPIAFIDQNGEILKYYLFRINTLSTFFLALLVPVWLDRFTEKVHLPDFKTVIFFACLIFLFKPAVNNIYPVFIQSKDEIGLDEVSTYIKQNTDPKSLIFSYDELLSLSRKTERNLFSVYKFIPSQLSKIPEWYNRIIEKQEVLSDPSKLNDLVNKYGIDYILVPKNIDLFTGYKVAYHNNIFILYETGAKKNNGTNTRIKTDD